MDKRSIGEDRLELLRTKDGSFTLYDRELDETYHSKSGARSESRHVFIERGLFAPALEEERKEGELRILELGLGTGLNALLTLEEADSHGIRTHYEGIEPFPLGQEIIEALLEKEGKDNLRRIHSVDWERPSSLTPFFTLFKRQIALEELEDGEPFDLIYFDAFGGKVRSELWEFPLLERILRRGKKGAVFVTYASKGSLKRALKRMNWEFETLEGALGKREMIRAVKKRNDG